MRIYLGDMEFPAAPEKLEAEREGGWVSAELETLGEILQHRPSRLRAVRFSGIFPGTRMGFVTAETLQDVLNEEQEAYDNLPEGLQESDRGQQMQEYIDALEGVVDSLGELDIEDLYGTIEEIAEG